MDRARRALWAALLIVLVLGLTAAGATPREIPGRVAAAVSWPVATLLVSEVQTGGASASDEFVELTNVGSQVVDLAGLEVVYVTATGGTITRKATWVQSVLLEPGRHLLLANSLGVHALLADVLYSGGLSATGGSLVLRPVGGAPVDAVGWGDASSAYVEGVAAPAPPVGASIERRPGGLAGNTQDTNDNLADWFIQPEPEPQTLAAPPAPVPVESRDPGSSAPPAASPSPTPPASGAPAATDPPTPAPSSSPSPTPTPSPCPSSSNPPSSPPEPIPTASPSSLPAPTTLPDPGASPSVAPSPSFAPSPTDLPSPSVAPSPAPSSAPTPGLIPIGDARLLPDGSTVTVAGVLTVPLGLLEDGRAAFVEDATGGIAIYLDQAPGTPWPAGTLVRLTGTLDDRYAARTLRVAMSDVTALGAALLPEPVATWTGQVGEGLEGRRVRVEGRTSGSPTAYADGMGLLVDDGSGAVRVIVSTDALGDLLVPAGSLVTITGPVGQRDSSGSGSAGYRIHATQPGELALQPVPDPSPTPGETAAPSPLPSSLPGDRLVVIAEARLRPIGTRLVVAGVVTAEAGRLGAPALLAVQDASGGIVIRLADGMAPPARGAWLEVEGSLADPYGQLELRLIPGGIRVVGLAGQPAPLPLPAAGLGEGTEGRLVTLEGTVVARPAKSTSNDISLDVTTPDGTRVRVMADASSGLVPASLQAGQAYRLTGVAGQRASRKGALDGYRIWLRDALDVAPVAAPGGVADSAVVRPLSMVADQDGATVVVEGRVTAPATLLDATGRRIVIQDATGALEVLLPLGVVAPPVDTWVRVSGTIGRAYDAPRLRATQVDVVPDRSEIAPAGLHGQPGATLEWRLAVATGTVAVVTRLGARWRAELDVDGTRILLDGLPGAAIPSTALAKGQRLTVLGIVRRPYPGATERRFSLVPRAPADLRTAAGAVRAPGQGDSSPGLSPASPGFPGGGSSWSYRPAEMDLATIEEHAGAWVRIGGLVSARDGARLVLDDGTAMAPVHLDGEAAAYVGLVVAGDAVNAVGIVVADPVEGWEVLVTSADGLVRVGSLGQSVAIGAGRPSGQLPEAAAPEPGMGVIGDRSGTAAGGGDRPVGAPEAPAPAIVLGLAPLVLLAARWAWMRWEPGRSIGRRLSALVHARRKAA